MRLAVIGGDGIGPEVTAEALKVLRAVHDELDASAPLDIVEFPYGAQHFLATGEVLTDEQLVELATFDAILLGAVGAPGKVEPGVLERGLLLKLRFGLDHHVNLRPSYLYRPEHSPLAAPREAGAAGIDFVVVREGTEGLYCGNGGSLRRGTAHEVASEVSQNTRYGVERVVRYAFDLARTRRKELTLVHKKNVLTFAGDLWQRTVDEVAADYPDVTTAYEHIDAATIHLVNDPGRFDVIVTDNLFGDILTDLAAAITGGIGLAASGSIDSSGANPPMFEPVHGSAPDIAGTGVADPVAAISSVALMLRYRGEEDKAQRIEAAVAAELAQRDGTTVRTIDVGDRIAAAVSTKGA
ncbi:3-isopropylmalate dehydrogenase [Corynebacterium incognita]|uniref:3-isopropylmalate dehydrogenase n=1 Tax=Corynebacterium incognita TaxID=2754725 RepID=A0A7G7CPE5_9CORY|nr:3-isopropylmalate dehydrogenase [Corynebacterium incognita]QNE89461.1 3-isopropylmalate dehydrogenase [Corynebacterium incognita]